jgi:aminomethyltransferase
MPIPTPFHPRTAVINESFEWRNWAGYLAAGLYEPTFEREYFAIRNSAAMIDVSPLFKYEISGPDAARVVDRIITRDAGKCRVGQVLYTPWCDEEGKVIDDGTVARLEENHFRITAAEPNLRWFLDVAYGFDAQVVDVSQDQAALSLQGPKSRAILKEAVSGIDFERLAYFYLAQGVAGDIPLTVTRTGYTGDLGYELWLQPQHAPALWDHLLEAGSRYGILPAGIVPLDIARIEAGLFMLDVDYISAHHARIEAQKSSPFELGLGWAVALDGADYIGRNALRAEKARGSKWSFIGVAIDWLGLERLYDKVNLPPQVTGRASRDPVPIFKGSRQVGQITSRTFSPLLKKYIGIGTVLSQYAAPGTQVDIEVTVEYSRERGPATITRTPFYNPPHKRA